MTSTPRQRYTDAASSLSAVNLKTSALKGVVASVAAETSSPQRLRTRSARSVCCLRCQCGG